MEFEANRIEVEIPSHEKKNISSRASSGSHTARIQGHAGVFQRLAELLQSRTERSPSASQLHPLDPLNPDEIAIAARVCREHVKKSGDGPLRFNAITLQVPLLSLASKGDLTAFT